MYFLINHRFLFLKIARIHCLNLHSIQKYYLKKKRKNMRVDVIHKVLLNVPDYRTKMI